jgi:hypothetical protein
MTSRAVQGMARVRSGQAQPGPRFLTGVADPVSPIRLQGQARFRVYVAGAFPPVPIVLRAESRLMLEGRHVHSAGYPRI